MSYNIQYQKKYSYTKKEINTPTYIFEIILQDITNNRKTFRYIKKSNQGNLLSKKDNILYNLIKKYKLTIFDINNPNEPIIIKQYLDHSLTTNTYLANNIYIEINQEINNLINIDYHINFNL